MLSVRGYFRNNRFVPDGRFSIPDGKPVIVTILDDEETTVISESERQRKIFAEFFVAIEADDEALPPLFDEVISEGMAFREVDFS